MTIKNTYSQVPESLRDSAGYFEPKSGLEVISEDFTSPRPYPGQIVYYPGSFGEFHDGHRSVVRRIEEDFPGALIVIAPSNSDYNVEKYGAWSVRSSNKLRYEKIKEGMKNCKNPWMIDINSMLNFTCDQNFTDMLQLFLKFIGVDIQQIPQPIIIGGKDKNWSILNEYQDCVRVVYYNDITGLSTKNLKNEFIQKKTLILRCNSIEEFSLFSDYFGDQYSLIRSFYSTAEIETAKTWAKLYGFTHTICKEYADFLPYIKLSRVFDNPLEEPYHISNGKIKPGMRILDSDIYSGSTKRFIESCGASLEAVVDLSGSTDRYELLDISDFYKDDYGYPFVDISSRCSMQAFDFGFHHRYNSFKKALKELKNG